MANNPFSNTNKKKNDDDSAFKAAARRAYQKSVESRRSNSPASSDSYESKVESSFSSYAPAEYSDKYLNKTYDDNFIGQFGASYAAGRLGQDESLAWNEYLNNPTEENKRKAQGISEIAKQFRENNEGALDDDAVAPWISQSLAGYLPQLVDQTKASAAGAAAGGVTGAAVGSVVPGLGTAVGAGFGIKAGIVAGSGVYSYNTMRGAAYKGLIDLGVPEDVALEAASDEAVVSALIEMADTGLDIATLGVGSLIKTITKGGAKTVAKAAGKEATEQAAKRFMKALGKYGLNVAGEYAEEYAQETVSMANQDRMLSGGTSDGFLGLASDSAKKLFTMSEEEREQAHAAGMEGAKIGAMMGGATAISTNAANTYIQNKRGKDLNADIDVLIEDALTSDPSTEAYKLATAAKAKRANGGTISNIEATKLAEANQRAINWESAQEAYESEVAANKPAPTVESSVDTTPVQSRVATIQTRLAESGMEATQAESVANTIDRILSGDTSVSSKEKDVLSMGNAVARQIFEEETGAKLPSSNSSTRKAVSEYIAQTAMKQQKAETAKPVENVMTTWQNQKVQEEKISQLKDKGVSFDTTSSPVHSTLQMAAEVASARTKAKEAVMPQNTMSTVGSKGRAVYQEHLPNAKSVSAYTRAFQRYYDAGQIGYPLERMKSEYGEGADPKMLVEAYKAGVEDASVRTEGVHTPAKKAAQKGKRTASKSKGKFYDNRVDKSSRSVDEKTQSALKQMAKVFNVDIEIVDTIPGSDGKSMANGYYANGKIVLAADSDNPLMTVVKHEITHHLQKTSPKQYKAFKDYVMQAFYGNSQEAMNAEIQRRIDLARLNNVKLTREGAMDEIVADATEKFLTDRDSIDALVRENRSLAETILNAIRDVLRKIEAAMKGVDLKGYSDFMNADQLKQAEKMWVEALTSAAMEDGVGIQYDGDSQSVAPVWSLKTWNESEYVKAREDAAKKMAKQLGITKQAALDYIDDINSIARLIADDQVRLDYDSNLDENATVLKANSEYKYSVDMSTLCAKRLLFTGTFDAIQRALPNTAFDSDDIVRLRKMMVDRNLEVACGICYVESTRREIGKITQDFIERYKLAQKTGKPITRLNSEGKVVDLKKTKDQMDATVDKSTDKFYADKDYTPTLADLNTTDIDFVKRDHPLVYEAYLNFMNARGQAKPKLLETRAEYKGEILKHFKAKSAVKARNAHGGLRLQSFSDFEVPHMIDMMQVIMDMSRVGLQSQAYTKVPAFAEVFGGTGVKINLSLIAKGDGLDADGNLIFDDVEGINHKEAFRLRDLYSKNVGTILVGKNDAHIIAAMADPRIDFIIPFHKSSWKESLYEALGLTGYDNYTDTQNEKPIDKDRKISNFDPSEYWDFSKTGDENAQIYLEKCREDGRVPKFPQFQGYPGYWKLLIDFKMYDNDGVGSPQTVVRPDFNMDAANRILDDYKGGHRSLPVAKDVVDAFVSEYKAQKNTTEDGGVQYSLKYDDAIDQLESGTLDKSKNSHLLVAENTPRIYIDKADAKDLKIIMAWDTAYLAMNKKGEISGNYHGLGADVMKAIPKALEDPLYIVKQDNDRIVAVTEIVVKGKRPTLASIELDTYKATTQDGEFESDNYNLIVTVFDAQPSYLQNTVFKGVVKYNKNNEDPAHFILRLKSLKKAVSDDDHAASSVEDTVSQPEYSVKKKDSDYMAAVERGDMETAQKMVDEKANEAFKDSVLRDKDGKLFKVYHGSKAKFNVFRGKEISGASGEYFSPWKKFAEQYGEARAFYVNLTNPQKYDYDWNELNDVPDAEADGVIYTFEDIEDGFDPGSFGDTEIIVYDNKAIKSADPVTYDDNGNVIPLSERFNTENEDIRFSFKDRGDTVTRGILIGDADFAYSEEIMSGRKKGETRYARNALLDNAYKTGERIALVRSGVKGRFAAYATTKIGKPIHFDTYEKWRKAYDLHRVPKGSKYDWDDSKDGKWFYPFEDLSVLSEEQLPTSHSPVYAKFADEPQYQLKTPDEMLDITQAIMAEEHKAKAVTDAEIMSQAIKDLKLTGTDRTVVENYQKAMKTLADYEKKLAVYEATKGEHGKGRSIYTDASGKVKKSGLKYSEAEKAEIQRKVEWWKAHLKEIERKEAFQKVLKREKAKMAERHAKEISDLRAKYDARMTELRDKRDEKIEAEKQRMRDYKQAQRDSKEYKALKSKLESDVKWLSDRLVNPTEAKHIPDKFRGLVAKFLETLDFTTERMDKNAKDGNPSGKTIKLWSLIEEYQEIAKGEDSNLVLTPIEKEFYDAIKETFEGGKRIENLTYEELEMIRDIVRYIKIGVAKANNSFNEEIMETISAMGDALIMEQRSKKSRKEYTGLLGVGDKLISYDNVAPADKFHEFGGVMEKLYSEIRKGFDKHIGNVQSAIDYTQKLIKGHEADLKQWSGKKAKATEFQISDGTTIELTPAQVMSLYCLMKRGQAVGHVLGSGIVPSGVEVQRNLKIGKVNLPATKKLYSERASRCTIEDIQKIVATLTPEQKKIADGVMRLFTTKCADWGNETSLRLYDIKKFTEANYFPIKSSDAYLNARFDDSGDALIKNLGFTKNTVVNANNPIVIEDIFDVLADHVNKMSMYNALVVPLTDFTRVFNYKQKNSDGTINDSVQKALETSGGSLGIQYIKQFMKDVNKQANSLAAESFINQSISRYKKAKIAASARVLLQQPTAITRAAAMVDPKYLIKGLQQKANYEEMFSNSEIAYWKSLGFYQTDMGRNMKDILLDNESKVDRLAMGLYGRADDFAWGHLWNAIKLEQADAHPGMDKTSSEFMELVANRFEEVVDRTQVVDSIFHRSQNMRSPGAAIKVATAFMSEPIKSFNLLRTDLIDSINSKDYSKFKRSVVTYVANAILVSAFAGFADMLRDDDDEDDDGNKRNLWDKYRDAVFKYDADAPIYKKITGNIADNINPLGMIPYLKELNSMIQGYDVNRMEMASIAEFVKTARKWTQGKYSVPYLLKETAEDFSELFGLPLKNAARDVIALARTAWDLVGGHYYEAYMADKMKYNISNPDNRSVFYKHYTDALLAGDEVAADMILKDMVVNGIPYDNIISKGYQKEKEATFSEARKLIASGKIDDARKLVQELARKYDKKFSTLWKSVKTGEDEPEETYDFKDLQTAVRKGKDTELIEDYLTEYGGYSEEDLEEAIKLLTEKYR